MHPTVNEIDMYTVLKLLKKKENRVYVVSKTRCSKLELLDYADLELLIDKLRQAY